MIIKLILAIGPVGLILITSEYLWRKKVIKGERARKFIHILAGIWMAFWPFYVPFDGIFILGAMSLTILLYSRLTRLFHAIYAVKRKTYGDILYALALIVCAYLGRADWIFLLSILLLAVADGGAAVVGRFWGLTNQYFVLGSNNLRKSIAGTATFIVLTYICIGVAWFMGGSVVMKDNLGLVFLALPICVTTLENFSPFGTDNLITPLFATVLLNSTL